MSPWIFTVGVLHIQLVKFLEHRLAIVPGNILLASHADPEESQGADLFRVIPDEIILLAGQIVMGRYHPAGAEYPQVWKHRGIIDSDIQSLQSPH